MHTSPPTARRALHRALALVLVTLGLGLAPTAAHAAGVTTTDPSTGATLTLTADAFTAGQRVAVSGTGYTAASGALGSPIVAVKVDDGFGDGNVNLNFGGADATDAVETGLPSFTVHDDGTWSGWIDLPSTLALSGPGTGTHAGKHWLRVLSGAFSSGGDAAGRKTVPITFQAWFTAVAPVTTGYTNATTSAFFPGSTLAPSTSALTVKGAAIFGANAAVTATLDGTPVTINDLGTSTAATTDASGAFNAQIPSLSTTAGTHTLTVSTGSGGTLVSREVTLTTVAHAVALVNSTVRPGGTVAVKATGFVGIAGTGQKVGLVAGSTVLACETAASNGSITLAGTVPPSTPTGPLTLAIASGTNCNPANGIVDPVNRVAFAAPTVAADAPLAASTFKVAAPGVAVPITGKGFGSTASVAVKLDDTAVTTLNAGADVDTSISGNLTVPAGTSVGTHLFTFTSSAGTAVLPIEVIAAPTVTLTPSAGSLAPSGQLQIDLAGFRRGDDTVGQKVGVKIDTGAIIGCVATDAAGAGTTTITLPADIAAGDHTLRLLTGTSCISGGAQDDLPVRSIAKTFTVAIPTPDPTPTATPEPTPTTSTTPAPSAAPTATPVPTLAPAIVVPKPTKVSLTGATKRTVRVALSAGTVTEAEIAVASSAKLRLAGSKKAAVVSLISAKRITLSSGKTKQADFALTAAGRKALAGRSSLKVVVTVTPAGGTAVKTTLTLKAK